MKANAPQCRVIIVANRTPQAALQEVSRKDFEQSIERKVDIVIPYDLKAATQAAKLGQPFVKGLKAGKLQPFTQLLGLTVATAEAEAEDAEGGAEAAAGSLFGKLGNLKALIAKKPEPKAKAA